MFEAMRRNTKIIMWITAAAFILLIFLAWGAEYQFGKDGGSARGVIGRVNGEPIHARIYRDRILAAREGFRQQGQNPDDAAEVQIRLQAWDSLIQEMLVQQEIDRMGIKVSDEEIVHAIRNQPLPAVTQSPDFQTDGQFDYSKYLAALQDPTRNWLPLERYYRADLPKQKLQQLVMSSAKVSEADIRRQFEDDNTKASATFVHIQSRHFPVDESEFSDSDLQSYYEANKLDYASDPQAWVEYVQIDKVPTMADTTDARELIQAAAMEADEGEDFDMLVSAYSEAPVHLQGGDTGIYLTRDQIRSPGIREAAFTLEIGEHSDILLESDGYHIIFVEDRRTTDENEEVKYADIFVPITLSGETMTEIYDRSVSLATGSVDYGGSLAATAEAVYPDLEAITAGPFSRSGYNRELGRLGQISGFRDWAFNGEIDAIRTIEGPTSWFVARILKRRPTGISPFEEVRDRVTTEYKASIQTEKASEQAEAILSLVQGGMTLEEAAATDTLATYGTTDEFQRGGFARGLGNDPAIMARVFNDPIGLVPQVIGTKRGAYIVEIVSRTDPDESTYPTERENIRRTLMQRRRAEIVSRWMEDLRARAEIEDYRGEAGI